MQEKIFSFLRIFASSQIIVWVLIVGIISSSFSLWSGIKKRGKKKLEYYRPEQVFDIIVLPFLFGVLLARLTYILDNWDFYREIRWFIIPYEKIDGEIFWFETFPWLFLKMGLQTVSVEGFAVGFLFGVTTAKRIHQMKWSKISLPLADFVGLIGIFGNWIVFILTENKLFLYPMLLLATVWMIKNLTRKSFDYFRDFTEALWKLFAFLWFPVLLLYTILVYSDGSPLWKDVVIVGVVSVYCLWITLKSMDIKILHRKSVVSQRRIRRKPVVKKESPRSFSLSYKSLTSNWWNKWKSAFKKTEDE
jgi:hypothetical protein